MHTDDPDAYRMGEPRPLNQSPFGQTGETSPSRDKLCLGGGPHADGACHCCSCVHRVRIDRGRTRLVRVPAADGQRTSSVTSGGQLAVYRQEVRPFTDTPVALLKNFSVLISWAHKRKSLVEIGESSRTTRFASERGEFSPNGSQFGYVPCVRSACIRSAACAACRRYRRR